MVRHDVFGRSARTNVSSGSSVPLKLRQAPWRAPKSPNHIGAISRKGKRARRCAHRSGRQVARRHHGTLLHAEARGSSRGPVNPVFGTSVAAPGWNPASTFIRLRHRKNSLARHGRGAEQGAETRTSRGVPFAGRRRLSRPARHLSTLRTDGGRAQRSGGKGTAITLQVYCDAPALETRTPTASQRHRPRGTRPRTPDRTAPNRRTVWSLPDPAAPNGRKKRR